MGGIESVPDEYGYVAIVLAVYCFMNLWLGMEVGKARKKYKVFYPTMYATEAENKNAKLFNCVQRGHQNSIELMPMFFVLMILGGIKHPVISASIGAVYTVSRYLYFKAYSKGDPDNRFSMRDVSMGGLLGLMICTISFGVHMLKLA